MDKKRNETILFLVLIILSLAIFLLDRWGVLLGVRGLVESALSPSRIALQKVAFQLPFLSNAKIASLEEERNMLREKLVTLEELEKENEDLRMQLGIPKEGGQKLMLASVLSTGRFFIIDKGKDDGVRVGNTVVFKNIFIGKVMAVAKTTSRVLLPIEKDSVLEAKVVKSGARGLVKGERDRMLFSEVTLSENVSEDDTIVTMGDVDEEGLGVRPGLLVGKASMIRKSEDQLFQEANITPLVDYKNLQNVFIIL